MGTFWQKGKPFILTVFIVSALLLLMDSCMQFRMSSSEIEEYFEGQPHKGTIHSQHLNDRLLSYLEVGNSSLPLLVFVHGSPGSLSAFIHFMKDTMLLARTQMISVDRPGFGASNFGYAEPSLEKQAAFLKPVLEMHKNQRPIILVGHSLGGPLIARMAMDYPDLVDGLIFVAPSIDPELEPNEWFRAPLATPFIKWMLPRSIRASNEEIYHLKEELEAMLPLWPKVRARSIVIQGGKDSLVPPANAEFARKMLSNAAVKIVLVENMDHFVPWSNPELIRNAVLELLK